MVLYSLGVTASVWTERQIPAMRELRLADGLWVFHSSRLRNEVVAVRGVFLPVDWAPADRS